MSYRSLSSRRIKTIQNAGITLFSRQLATLLTAGVPLLQGLDILGKSTSKDRRSAPLQQLIEQLAEAIQSGLPLSAALQQHPSHFDTLYCNLVAAGETSGALALSFQRIATYREQTARLKMKLRKALTYPAVVILVAVAVSTLLLVFVVPQFETIFADFGAQLPVFTRFVIRLSDVVQSCYLQVLIASVIGLYWCRRRYRRSQTFRDQIDRGLLKVPVLKSIVRQLAIARSARTLATTFTAGVPLVETLQATAHTAGNAIFRQAFLQVREDVAAGLTMHQAMQHSSVFPPMVIQMVRIGEEVGAVDTMVTRIAELYEAEVDEVVDHLANLLEPLLMLVIGSLVGSLIISMYLPIFQLGKVVG